MPPGARLRPFVRSRSPIAEFDQRLSADSWSTPLSPTPMAAESPGADLHPPPSTPPDLGAVARPPDAAPSVAVQPGQAEAPPATTAREFGSVEARATRVSRNEGLAPTLPASPFPAGVTHTVPRPAARSVRPENTEPPGPVRIGAATIAASATTSLSRSAASPPAHDDSTMNLRSPVPTRRTAETGEPAHSSPRQSQPAIPTSASPHASGASREGERADLSSPTAPRALSPETIPLPAAAGPQVVIDRLQIDVVPPPPPAAPATARSSRRAEAGARTRGPISQIGPLGQGPSTRHHLALRYR
jgi:hypothetical protein